MKSFLKFEEMDYLIHYVKFEMSTALFYVNYLSYFQQRNLNEVRNCRVTKSSSKTELRKMTSYLELLTRNFL